MTGGTSIAGRAAWIADGDLQKLLAALSDGDEKARIAGGAVRNALLGEDVTDIDIATTTTPEETTRRAEKAGFRAVPTGAEHGTITVIAGHRPYEVTTLRADVETDGRRARVVFGRDWKADAERRDFTINGLYAEADGTVVDMVGGLTDLAERRLRFIGDAETRIREDYLRILRFFRFFAWYGDGRPDPEGLKASARLKEGLDRLSAERVWSELKKLLGAPDPSRALLWMRQAGVLSRVLPESERWGIDAIPGLIRAEADLGWAIDPMLRLEAIVPPDAERMSGMADRLKMSKAETSRLREWALAKPIAPETTEGAFARLLYRADEQAFVDRLKLDLAAARARAVNHTEELVKAGGYARLLSFLGRWSRPSFPLRGADVVQLGAEPGPQMGALLAQLELEWIESGFTLDRDELLSRAGERIERHE